MPLKKWIIGLIALVLVLLPVTSCGSSGAKTAIQLVPSNANFVAMLQPNVLLSDPDLMEMYEGKQADSSQRDGKSPQERLNEFSRETGIDLKSISEMVIFGDMAEMQDPGTGYFGFIVLGDYDPDKLVQRLKSEAKNEVTETVYKDFTLYSTDDSNYALSFISNKQIIFGSEQAVKDTLDIQAGEQKPLSGPIIDAYNKLGDATLKAVFNVAAAGQNSLEQGMPDDIPLSMDMFGSIDMVGFVLDKEGKRVNFRADMRYPDSQDLRDGEEAFRGIIALFKSFTKDEGFKALLGKIEISSKDPWLSISLTTTVDELKNASEAMNFK